MLSLGHFLGMRGQTTKKGLRLAFKFLLVLLSLPECIYSAKTESIFLNFIFHGKFHGDQGIYHTLYRVDHGHRTLLGEDLTLTTTQSETRTPHFPLKNEKMERSPQTDAKDFQLSTTNVKIDWRKPFRLADTLQTEMCWERVKPLNQALTGLNCHSSFNPITTK